MEKSESRMEKQWHAPLPPIEQQSFLFTFASTSAWLFEPTMLPLVDESVWHILSIWIRCKRHTNDSPTPALLHIHRNKTKIKLIFAVNTCFQVGWFFVVFLRVFPVHPLLFATLNAHQSFCGVRVYIRAKYRTHKTPGNIPKPKQKQKWREICWN